MATSGTSEISETTGASENPDPPVNDTGPPTGEDTDQIDRNQKRAKKLESRVDKRKDAKQSNGIRADSFADVLTDQKKGPGQSQAGLLWLRLVNGYSLADRGSSKEGTRTIERNRKIGSRFGEFGDRRIRGIVGGIPPKLPDFDHLNSGEAQIDHGGVPAAPRATSRVHSGHRRGVQGREPPPPASSPPLPPIPAALWLTGLGPVRFFSQAQPKPSQAQRPVQPIFSSGRFLLRAGDPIQPDCPAIFFIYREAPQLSGLGKFST
ncbi:hypothetical protein CRG98_037802 [Punica granatum]|uniref:Uncharacterized protein n=1 Tax=Punica granatum TaxID=22663 RepID=A0A2I0ICU1_PUNGR|nr:hypothetical protein CRG98_037802 [Punica granatum]